LKVKTDKCLACGGDVVKTVFYINGEKFYGVECRKCGTKTGRRNLCMQLVTVWGLVEGDGVPEIVPFCKADGAKFKRDIEQLQAFVMNEIKSLKEKYGSVNNED